MLVQFHEEVQQAMADLMKELKRRYPIGVRVLVKIQRNHKRPTRVTVVGYAEVAARKKYGCLRVRILKNRYGEGGFITTVHFSQVEGYK